MTRPFTKIRLEFGLGGLVRQGIYGYRFDKSSLESQCEDVCKNLPALIKHTNIPGRLRNFRLNVGRTAEVPKLPERCLEQAIWSATKKDPSAFQLGSICTNVHSYQVPLWRHKENLSTGEIEVINKWWKKSYIDLLGVDVDGFPVVLELKKTGKGSSNPLHMIVEAALYGVAVKTMWSRIIPEWKLAFGDNVQQTPLKTCRLIGIAPYEYWEHWRRDESQRGLWKPLARLCSLLAKPEHGLPAFFAGFTHGELDGTLPEIRDVRRIILPD